MNRKLSLTLAAAVAGLAGLGAVASLQRSVEASTSLADIVVDTAGRFQPIEGWEVTVRGWDINKIEDRFDPSFAENMDEVADVLVNQAGVNRLRLELGTNAESPVDHWTPFERGEVTHTVWQAQMYDNHNDNKDPFVVDPDGFQWAALDYKVEKVVLPVRAALAARGEKLFLNLCVVDFAKGSLGSLDVAVKPEEYAELVVAAFDHLKSKYGLTPDALEITLEPENAGTWKAERFGPAIKAVSKRLAAKGYDPQIIAPSTTRASNAIPYFNTASRSGARIDVLAYHSYDRPGDDIRREIARTAAAAGVKTAMLEHLRADVNEFYRDMTLANVSSWQQWAIGHFKDDGKYLLVADLTKPKGKRVRLGTRTRFLAQVWRHARIGDVRVAATTANPALKPLAFSKADGGMALSVIVDAASEFSISGLPPGDYEIERTTAKELGVKAGTVKVARDGRASLAMPSPGVITISRILPR